jgi:hypothetical protein
LATFANLRFGELAGLRRDQLDLDACEVRVNASTWEMEDGRLIDGDPKPNGLVFIGPKGGACDGRTSARSGTELGERSTFPNSTSTT